MPVYVITGDKVAACKSAPAEIPEGGLLVRTADDLEKSALPNPRLVAIWNSLHSATKVAKFKDRKTAAQRLWTAFGKLPETADPDALAVKAKAAGRKSARPPGSGGRAESKQAKVIALLKRPGGATLDALVKATGWQRHTVRGAIAGALKKRLKLKIVSQKSEDGVRTYRIAGR